MKVFPVFSFCLIALLSVTLFSSFEWKSTPTQKEVKAVFAIDDLAVGDCSTTSCNCELSVTISEVSNLQFFAASFGKIGNGICDEITSQGMYTFTVDMNDLGGQDHRYAIFNHANGTSAHLKIEGCGVDIDQHFPTGAVVFFFPEGSCM